jgi:hypothetical protein
LKTKKPIKDVVEPKYIKLDGQQLKDLRSEIDMLRAESYDKNKNDPDKYLIDGRAIRLKPSKESKPYSNDEIKK